MAPSGSARDDDWIWSNSSNVHVANHRDWFTTFETFESKTSEGALVAGVGTVSIEVAIPGDTSGTKHNTITLHDVLFAPDTICNIIGSPICKDYDISDPFYSPQLSKNGELVGVFDSPKLCRLRLPGQTEDYTSLDKDCYYMIRATWDKTEQTRWKALKLSA